eukprot:687208-Pelagomonas_calceolata.AAC.1
MSFVRCRNSRMSSDCLRLFSASSNWPMSCRAAIKGLFPCINGQLEETGCCNNLRRLIWQTLDKCDGHVLHVMLPCHRTSEFAVLCMLIWPVTALRLAAISPCSKAPFAECSLLGLDACLHTHASAFRMLACALPKPPAKRQMPGRLGASCLQETTAGMTIADMQACHVVLKRHRKVASFRLRVARVLMRVASHGQKMLAKQHVIPHSPVRILSAEAWEEAQTMSRRGAFLAQEDAQFRVRKRHNSDSTRCTIQGQDDAIIRYRTTSAPPYLHHDIK